MTVLAELPPCPITPPTKICKRCGVVKVLDDFHNKTEGKFGKAFHCKTCAAELNVEYRARNPERIKQKIAEWHANNLTKKWDYHRKKYETPRGRAMHLYNAAKKRKPDGLTITLDHIVAGIERGFCAVTGIPFHLTINRKEGITRHPFAPSLDKIEPKESYTNANTRVVIWQYNAMKGELSDAEVLDICRVIVARSS